MITWALLQALGPRATLVRVQQRRPSMSSPRRSGITPPGGTILVGVQVDPAAALQLRDMGPPADDVQVSLCVCPGVDSLRIMQLVVVEMGNPSCRSCANA